MFSYKVEILVFFSQVIKETARNYRSNMTLGHIAAQSWCRWTSLCVFKFLFFLQTNMKASKMGEVHMIMWVCGRSVLNHGVSFQYLMPYTSHSLAKQGCLYSELRKSNVIKDNRRKSDWNKANVSLVMLLSKCYKVYKKDQISSWLQSLIGGGELKICFGLVVWAIVYRPFPPISVASCYHCSNQHRDIIWPLC